MSFHLSDILKIRKHKEQSALIRLMKTQRDMQAARHQSESAARQLTEFISHRKDTERCLFNVLKSTSKTILHLDRFNLQADILKQEEERLATRLDDAEKKISLINKELEEAKTLYTVCCRKKYKLETQEKIRCKEQTKANERHAEELRDEFNTAVNCRGMDS